MYHDQQHIGFLEEIQVSGFLSPGGAEEVALALSGGDVARAHVLDIGAGFSACALLQLTEHGSERVNGIHVEDPVCIAAVTGIGQADLPDRIDTVKISP